jgi:alpha-glucosidase
MKYILLLLFSLCLIHTDFLFAQTSALQVQSPNGNLQATVSLVDEVSITIRQDGNTLVKLRSLYMNMGNQRLQNKIPRLESQQLESLEETIQPQVPYKDATIPSRCNQLTLSFTDDFKLLVRAYDDGIAYRFVEERSGGTVVQEGLRLDLPADAMSWFPQEESMYSHNERLYLQKSVSDIPKGDFCSLPVLFEVEETKVLFTEASLHDYPGMFLESNGKGTFEALFPPFVLEAVPDEENVPDRNQILSETADYIARAEGPRSYPWRVFVIGDDRTLVESNLVTQLSEPSVLPDADWIRPGKVAWDWYNANNIFGVDFEAGLNTETYKYYIDFAAQNGIEYVILDEGWTKSTTEIMESNPEIDVPELIEYGKARDVGIILWVLWKPLDEKREEILKLYSDWGAQGIKVDFMQRNDQYMVRSYEEIAETAARYRLLVDFHGAFKPAGIERKWPNVINYEGVKGNENNKWSADISPEHNVTLPFTRMVAGPMDFTPGSMRNAHPENYAISFTRPMSLGTRCHQVAMYVVFEAPLQMMCESPSIYYKEQETVNFITRIPTVWEETRVLEAAVSDYILLARRKGDTWYLAAMTDATPRELTLDLSFLDAGTYQLEIMKDGANAHRYAPDYKMETLELEAGSKLPIQMAAGGGWVGILKKKE